MHWAPALECCIVTEIFYNLMQCQWISFVSCLAKSKWCCSKYWPSDRTKILFTVNVNKQKVLHNHYSESRSTSTIHFSFLDFPRTTIKAPEIAQEDQEACNLQCSLTESQRSSVDSTAEKCASKKIQTQNANYPQTISANGHPRHDFVFRKKTNFYWLSESTV